MHVEFALIVIFLVGKLLKQQQRSLVLYFRLIQLLNIYCVHVQSIGKLLEDKLKIDKRSTYLCHNVQARTSMPNQPHTSLLYHLTASKYVSTYSSGIIAEAALLRDTQRNSQQQKQLKKVVFVSEIFILFQNHPQINVKYCFVLFFLNGYYDKCSYK